jgi:hypothetical protein
MTAVVLPTEWNFAGLRRRLLMVTIGLDSRQVHNNARQLRSVSHYVPVQIAR